MKRKKFQPGFTLVETILTVVMMAIIAMVAARVLTVGLDIYALVVNRDDAFQSARASMDRMVEEMLLLSASDINQIQNTTFGFTDNGGSNTNFRQQTVSGVTSLFRQNDYMAGYVNSLDFDYKRTDGVNTTTISQVRRINIDFTMTALAGAGNIHLRTEVFPRNFMYTDFQ